MRLDARLSGRAVIQAHAVFLDGELLQRCVMADEELGIAEVLKLDARGSGFPLRLYTPAAGEGSCYDQVTELRRGRVEIRHLSMLKPTDETREADQEHR